MAYASHNTSKTNGDTRRKKEETCSPLAFDGYVRGDDECSRSEEEISRHIVDEKGATYVYIFHFPYDYSPY